MKWVADILMRVEMFFFLVFSEVLILRKMTVIDLPLSLSLYLM